MKRNRFRHPARTLAALVLLAVWPTLHAADWLDLRGAAPIHGDATAGAAKAALCVACHGPNGNSIIPAFPNLAGQKADYLYWEMVSFKSASPPSPMTAIVAPLGDADMRNLAAYFAGRTPDPVNQPAPPPTDRGEHLFHDGDPKQGTPPCQGCHGVDGGGVDDARFATWPMLRGQHADYIAARLKAYRDGKLSSSSNDFIMRGVAHTLDDDAIAALAAWLASLPPMAAH